MVLDMWGIFQKIREEFTPFEAFNMLLGCVCLPQQLYMLGHTQFIHDAFTEIYGTFDGIEPIILLWGSGSDMMAGRDSEGLMMPKSWIWQTKAMWSLCCPLDSPRAAEARQFLEDPKLASPKTYFENTVTALQQQQRQAAAVGVGEGQKGHTTSYHNIAVFVNFCNSYWVALANERYGNYERAMVFADGGIQKDVMVPGANAGVRWRSLCHCIRGRILAKEAGTKVEALAAFEAAIAEAKSCELYYLECLALRDMDRCLRPSGIHERISKVRGKFNKGVLVGDNLDDFNRILDNHSIF